MSNPLEFPQLINFSQVEAWLGKSKEDGRYQLLEKEIEFLIKKIDSLRNEGVPVYSIKGRVKSEMSVFLKTRRKLKKKDNQYCDFNDYTDYVGIRVLVMFDEELLDVFKALLSDANKIIENGMLREITIFNMPHIVDLLLASEELKRFLPGVPKINCKDYVLKNKKELKIKGTNKGSGYRSIHLLFAYPVQKGVRKGIGNPYGEGDNVFLFELQLRTLLDDVWGEMEHKLAYKQGMANPQIAASFKHLQEDLRTMGKRLSDLNALSSRHGAVDSLSIENAGPYNFLGYESDWKIENILSGNNNPGVTELRDDLLQFNDLAKKYNNDELTNQAYITTSDQLITDVSEKLCDASLSDKDKEKIHYYIEMEKGYLSFLRQDLKVARDIYKEIKDSPKYRHRPVPHFRFAEVSFVLHRISKNHNEDDLKLALQSFDEALRLVNGIVNSPTSVDPEHYRVGASILNKMAAVYELIGFDEYLDYCIELTKLAMAMIERMPPELQPDRMLILNNMGWYCVEKFRTLPLRPANVSVNTKQDATDLLVHADWHTECFNYLKPVLDAIEREIQNGPDSNAGFQISGNVLDTCAWLFYQTWRKVQRFEEIHQDFWQKLSPDFRILYSEKAQVLEKAREYCHQLWLRGRNQGVFAATSTYRQRHHTELIMDPCYRHNFDD
ncbi:MAG: hypothetical protein HQL95_10960 [Magnetococcales bacterium]|nr:hypothetical protein [Magnetococcales bacterium]